MKNDYSCANNVLSSGEEVGVFLMFTAREEGAYNTTLLLKEETEEWA